MTTSDDIIKLGEQLSDEKNLRDSKWQPCALPEKRPVSARIKDFLIALPPIPAGQKWLDIDFRQLIEFDTELAEEVIDDFEVMVNNFEGIYNTDILEINNSFDWISVHFHNLGQSIKKDVWALRAQDIGKLVCVRGKIMQIGEMFNRVFATRFQCHNCGKFYLVTVDTSNLDARMREPNICECGRKGKMRLVKEYYKDFQKIMLTESTKELNQKSIMVLLSGNLCRKELVKTVAINRLVEITGVVKLKQKKDEKVDLTQYVFANSIDTADELVNYACNAKDIAEFHRIAQSPSLFEDMAQSIHSNVSGMETIKLATLLQLAGGVPLRNETGFEERGVIHILMVSSPGMGKSQLAKNCIRMLPNANQAEGKATTGAGLVAALMKDEELGYSVSAGKVCLANGSLTFVDEMDKIKPEELTFLNTAMSQMFVNFDKGGLHVVLNTETAILAAMNPKHKVFDEFSNKGEQIGVEKDLLDRFDLVLPISPPKETKDRRKIVDLIINKYATQATLSEPIYPFELVAKYLNYIRETYKPTLTPDVQSFLAENYMALASPEKIEANSYFSYRLIGNIIRLAQASAKIRLSQLVELQDAQRALGLVMDSLRDQGALTENGKINYEVVEGIMEKSKRERASIVLHIIRGLCQKSEDHTADRNDIISELMLQKMPVDDIEEFLEKMHRSGDIYEARHNRYKVGGE